jgi:hypothetical protein
MKATDILKISSLWPLAAPRSPLMVTCGPRGHPWPLAASCGPPRPCTARHCLLGQLQPSIVTFISIFAAPTKGSFKLIIITMPTFQTFHTNVHRYHVGMVGSHDNLSCHIIMSCHVVSSNSSCHDVVSSFLYVITFRKCSQANFL